MPLADKLQKKLEGGKFRLMNQRMYQNKELSEKDMQEYHRYYTNQIKKWPVDPIMLVIARIKKNEKQEQKIADLGCGSGGIADHFSNVVLFDKYPIREGVIKCDFRKIPAADGDFDVTVCCLSLMMTGITGVLREINRIMKTGGEFYIAEVTSRVKNTHKFIKEVEKLGFKLKEIDKTNTHFFVAIFEKIAAINPDARLPNIKLDDWVYKKR